MKNEFLIWVNHRANKRESIEFRHSLFIEKMSKIDSPLGFKDLVLPNAPSCGENLSASFSVKGLPKGINFVGSYKFRGDKYIYDDSAKFDDTIRYGFKFNKNIEYKKIIHTNLPAVISAFFAYRCSFHVWGFASAYCGGYVPSEDGLTAIDENGYPVKNNKIYNKLSENKNIEIDGRNNIFTLHPAQYWDNELCLKALGYGSDEVIKRLSDKVIKAERLMDGVYLLLNDDPNITYEQFVGMNEKYKPILGLI